MRINGVVNDKNTFRRTALSIFYNCYFTSIFGNVSNNLCIEIIYYVLICYIIEREFVVTDMFKRGKTNTMGTSLTFKDLVS